MSQPDSTPPEPTPTLRHTGGEIAMILFGVVLLLPGLCTGIFGMGAIYDMIISASSEGFSILLEALLFGAIPLAIGGVLVFAAFKMRKKT